MLYPIIASSQEYQFTISMKNNPHTIISTINNKVNWISAEDFCEEPYEIGNSICDSYIPIATNQIINFEQTQNCTIEKERICQKREKDTISGNYRLIGERYNQNLGFQTHINKKEVTVSWSEWINQAFHYCSNWTPELNTIDKGLNITQTRTCDYYKKRNRQYSTGEIFNETELVKQDYTREGIGTKIISDSIFGSFGTPTEGRNYNSSIWSGYSVSNSLRIYGYFQNNLIRYGSWSVCFTAPVDVVYRYRNNSEFEYDFLTIDGTTTAGISEGAVSKSYSSGCRTIQFIYSKDGSSSLHDDSGYILSVTVNRK